MECPHCDETLRVMDRPAPRGSFFRLTCPARTCGKEIVVLAGDELTPLSRGEVRSHAARVVFHALRADFAFPLAGAFGTAALTVFLAVWQLLVPSEHQNNVSAVGGIAAGGAMVVAVFAASIAADLVIGIRGWRSSLPRPMVDVKTMPVSYRT